MNTSFEPKSQAPTQRATNRESHSAKAYPSRTIVHAKLEMTEPGDHDELEANAVASAIMSGGKISRKISSGASGSSGIAVSRQMESHLNHLQGSGQSMPEGLRNMMESGFGQDFSQVRLHIDSEAANMSSSIHAKAFTLGNDIYFNRGQFSPETKDGQHLIAHELTHTLQRSGMVARKKPHPQAVDMVPPDANHIAETTATQEEDLRSAIINNNEFGSLTSKQIEVFANDDTNQKEYKKGGLEIIDEIVSDCMTLVEEASELTPGAKAALVQQIYNTLAQISVAMDTLPKFAKDVYEEEEALIYEEIEKNGKKKKIAKGTTLTEENWIKSRTGFNAVVKKLATLARNPAIAVLMYEGTYYPGEYTSYTYDAANALIKDPEASLLTYLGAVCNNAAHGSVASAGATYQSSPDGNKVIHSVQPFSGLGRDSRKKWEEYNLQGTGLGDNAFDSEEFHAKQGDVVVFWNYDKSLGEIKKQLNGFDSSYPVIERAAVWEAAKAKNKLDYNRLKDLETSFKKKDEFLTTDKKKEDSFTKAKKDYDNKYKPKKTAYEKAATVYDKAANAETTAKTALDTAKAAYDHAESEFKAAEKKLQDAENKAKETGVKLDKNDHSALKKQKDTAYSAWKRAGTNRDSAQEKYDAAIETKGKETTNQKTALGDFDAAKRNFPDAVSYEEYIGLIDSLAKEIFPRDSDSAANLVVPANLKASHIEVIVGVDDKTKQYLTSGAHGSNYVNGFSRGEDGKLDWKSASDVRNNRIMRVVPLYVDKEKPLISVNVPDIMKEQHYEIPKKLHDAAVIEAYNKDIEAQNKEIEAKNIEIEKANQQNPKNKKRKLPLKKKISSMEAFDRIYPNEKTRKKELAALRERVNTPPPDPESESESNSEPVSKADSLYSPGEYTSEFKVFVYQNKNLSQSVTINWLQQNKASAAATATAKDTATQEQ